MIEYLMVKASSRVSARGCHGYREGPVRPRDVFKRVSVYQLKLFVRCVADENIDRRHITFKDMTTRESRSVSRATVSCLQQ